MSPVSFETALQDRIGEMVAACTRCGRCVAACPSVAPAGLVGADPVEVVSGVLDILRGGEAPEASRKWATSCTLSGACIEACDDGVNPRFLLAMARVAMTKAKTPSERRGDGLAKYRGTSQDVTVLSRMQLETAVLERLGQGAAQVSASDTPPEFIFYTGCNVLKTPHIALLALDIMDRLGIRYQTMGGPSHCCGVLQMRAGDVEMSGRMGASTVDKLSRGTSGRVLSWCPSCQVQFTETTLPTLERQRGTRPFEMLPFIRFLRERLDELKPHLREPVAMRVALHKHPGSAGVVEAATGLLQAVPGVELVDLGQPALGLQSASLAALPQHRRALQVQELDAAETAGIDALVAVYHSDHRDLCAHETDRPFRILNILDVVGASMGLTQPDRFKELKALQDADLVLAECSDMIARHGLDPDLARRHIVQSLLGEQPVALRRRKDDGAPQRV